MSEHSPLPWGTDPLMVLDADGRVVFHDLQTSDEDKALIVKACNHHEELMAVVQRLSLIDLEAAAVYAKVRAK